MANRRTTNVVYDDQAAIPVFKKNQSPRKLNLKRNTEVLIDSPQMDIYQIANLKKKVAKKKKKKKAGASPRKVVTAQP